jgi:hypothetical protein
MPLLSDGLPIDKDQERFNAERQRLQDAVVGAVFALRRFMNVAAFSIPVNLPLGFQVVAGTPTDIAAILNLLSE